MYCQYNEVVFRAEVETCVKLWFPVYNYTESFVKKRATLVFVVLVKKNVKKTTFSDTSKIIFFYLFVLKKHALDTFYSGLLL